VLDAASSRGGERQEGFLGHPQGGAREDPGKRKRLIRSFATCEVVLIIDRKLALFESK
jgi:hypothetical protein